MNPQIRHEAPDVSLVVIAFNEHERAPECIRSIMAQRTSATFEIVFVDDGSTDDTASAISALFGSDPRLRLVELSENQGRGAAREAGVQAARGSVIGFVDADISLPADWLEQCLAHLPGNAAVSGMAVPDGDAAVVARISGATPRPLPGRMPITGSNVLFERVVLESLGFNRRDRLGEDFRLAHRLVRAGHRLLRVPGLIVEHKEDKSFGEALRWRFANGFDAATHPRELGVIRFADVVWMGWVGAWVIGIVGSMTIAPPALGLGLAASAAVGIFHATSRFRPQPIGRFLLACVVDIPLMNAYMLGRTLGIPLMVTGRK